MKCIFVWNRTRDVIALCDWLFSFTASFSLAETETVNKSYRWSRANPIARITSDFNMDLIKEKILDFSWDTAIWRQYSTKLIPLNVNFIAACHCHEKFTYQRPGGNLFLSHKLLLHGSVRIKPMDFLNQNRNFSDWYAIFLLHVVKKATKQKTYWRKTPATCKFDYWRLCLYFLPVCGVLHASTGHGHVKPPSLHTEKRV